MVALALPAPAPRRRPGRPKAVLTATDRRFRLIALTLLFTHAEKACTIARRFRISRSTLFAWRTQMLRAEGTEADAFRAITRKGRRP